MFKCVIELVILVFSFVDLYCSIDVTDYMLWMVGERKKEDTITLYSISLRKRIFG